MPASQIAAVELILSKMDHHTKNFYIVESIDVISVYNFLFEMVFNVLCTKLCIICAELFSSLHSVYM
jgi:hypothetical protein